MLLVRCDLSRAGCSFSSNWNTMVDFHSILVLHLITDVDDHGLPIFPLISPLDENPNIIFICHWHQAINVLPSVALPSIIPVHSWCSKPFLLQKCPKNTSCLFLNVSTSDLLLLLLLVYLF